MTTTTTTKKSPKAATTAIASATVYDLRHAEGPEGRLLLFGHDERHAVGAALEHLRSLHGDRSTAAPLTDRWLWLRDPDWGLRAEQRNVDTLLIEHRADGGPPLHARLRKRRTKSLATVLPVLYSARFATRPEQNRFFPEETEGNPEGMLLVSLDHGRQARRAKHLLPQPTARVVDVLGP